MSWVGTVGFGALAVLVCGWLVVSFTAPGPRRTVVEWLSASAGFTALLMLFVHLATRAWQGGSTFALIAFGFLCVVFSSGLGVSLVQTVLSARAPRREQASATN